MLYLRLLFFVYILFCRAAFSAEPYPTKPITFVVTSSPGGGTDTMARLLAGSMSPFIGQPIVIENISGAGGAIGAGVVSRSKPDGYKILFTTGGFIIAPFLLPNSGYDPIKQFEGIQQIATVPLVIAVKNDSSINSLADLIAASKSGNPISFGSFGVGTPSHIAGESINYFSGSKFTHVPYGGSSKVMPDLQSGILSFGILDASYAVPMINQGVLRAIAVTGQKRLSSLPYTPTLVESGIPFNLVGWYGVFAPTGTPKYIIAKLHDAFENVLLKGAIKERIKEFGLGDVDAAQTPSEWTKKYQEDMRQWDELLKKLNIAKDK